VNNFYTDNEIMKKVHISLEVLFKNDLFLIENLVHERSIAHKLAEYLQHEFPDWNVDCEYNKKDRDTKILDEINECSKDRKKDIVYPDIIIHKRDTDCNLLVIEIKNNKEAPCDIKKLELFTSNVLDYKYKMGLFIKFYKKRKPDLVWFIDGKEVERED